MLLPYGLKVWEMNDITTLVRDNVKSLIPYSCARDEFQGREGIFMDANENPYGDLNRYPDPYQKELKEVISRVKGISAERIFLGNGSDEIIDLCFRVFCNPGTDKAITFHPSYGMYEVSAAVNDAEIIKIPLNGNFQIPMKSVEPYFKDERVKLIFICSPNNPTGNCINPSDIEFIIRNFKGVVVLDEAYNDFSDNPSFAAMTSDFENLIVMQTFSKAFGLASARVGMMFADKPVIHYFNKMKPPYNISTLNQKSALKKLGMQDEVRDQVRKIIKERERLKHNLEKISVVRKIWPSDSNFLLVEVDDADRIYNILVDNKIIIRNRNKLVKDCVRITVGTRYENNRLITILKNLSQ